MKTILVDDELFAMREFEEECSDNPFFDIVGTFDEPLKALEFAKNNKIEFALLDVEMPGMNGIELSKKLKEIYPNLVVVFVTAYDKYVLDALKTRADYVVLKPYGVEDVEDVISRAQMLNARNKKRIFINTFGSFDVFLDGKPVPFQSKRAKEMLALIVDRNGGIVSTADALATIWEDKDHTDDNFSMCRGIYARLAKTLTNAGIPELVISNRNGRMINKDVCDCDYFQFLDGNKNVIKKFNDDYMINYSWAEDTLAKLHFIKNGDH